MLAFVLFIVIHDLVTAFDAQPCPGGGPNCYPWGAEGPVAGLWHYATKDRYLYSEMVSVQIVLICIVIPFFTGNRWQGLGLIALAIFISFVGGRLAPEIIKMSGAKVR